MEQNGLQLFPRSNDGDIGDVMPYFDGEYMNYFYLLNEDQQSMAGFLLGRFYDSGLRNL